MFKVILTNSFKKDLKELRKNKKSKAKLDEVVTMLANGETLPIQFRNHKLIGNWKDCYECHIEPDWLLIYRRENQTLTLILLRTGSHSKLFKL